MERTLKILAVDDEQIVLDSIQKHLRKENYELQLVKDAVRGLEIIASSSPDIILTDLMMPEIDGLELLRRVKELNKHIPVIMITGYATINTALEATELGAFDYIAKPFTRSELKQVVERAARVVLNADGIPDEGPVDEGDRISNRRLKHVGENVWMMVGDDDLVILGAENTFLSAIGRVQTIILPDVGDKLRQGASFAQFFTADMRSYSLLSPFTGTITASNDEIATVPEKLKDDPYGEGWLVRLKPTRFDSEVKELGL